MAVGLIIEFGGVPNADMSYARVMETLGLSMGTNPADDWPEGIISHAAGRAEDGTWTVVDLWDSRADFDEFLRTRLGPAIAAVGDLPEPTVTSFEVMNSWGHLKAATIDIRKADARLQTASPSTGDQLL